MAKTASDGIAGRRQGIRAGLLVLALTQATTGLWALVAPSSFHADFPFGRGWVSALGPYDEHLVRDVGSTFTALTVLAVAAAVFLELRLVQSTLVVWLVFAVPHFAFHLTTIDAYATLDNVLSLAGLALQVVLPLALLALTLRSPAESAAPTA